MELSFGTNGVRGTFDRLTPLEAVKFSRAFGQWVQQTLGKKPSIILACDHRLTSPLLHSAALSGLLSSGADVIDIGLAPSPTAELMIHRLGAQGALVVTASHNPPEWNALKFVDWDGVAISRERGGQISKLLQSKGAQSLKIGRTSAYPGALDAHRQTILNSVDKQVFAGRQLKVVIDCANGTASLVAPYVFGDLGCTVITLNSHIDGTFPGRPSEPTEANLKDLKAAVVASKADLGIAFDGDSDRVIFIDEKGGFVVGDKGFALSLQLALLQYSKKQGQQAKPGFAPIVVTTVATSRVVQDIAEKYGCKMLYTKVGAPYISEAMHEKKAVFGGEEVGGIVWPDISLAKDGFLAAARLAQAVCSTPLSVLVGKLPAYYNYKTKLEASQTQKAKALAFMSKLKAPGATLTSIDGVRIDFADKSWVIVRASGTENYLRIFAEGRTQKQADSIATQYVEKIRAAIA